jgi:hypothetical protein
MTMDADDLKKYQFKKGHNSAPASGGKPAPAAAMKVPVLAIQIAAAPKKSATAKAGGSMKTSSARQNSDRGVKFDHKPAARQMDRLGKR